jgi:glycosyltransferase involved in cell wall biosynthesis
LKYWHYILKRKIEDIFILPFILLGRLIAILKPLNKEYKVFFFFPFYHTGGAEKVHALITQAVGNTNCIIFFSRKSVDNTFYKNFEISGCTIKDISAYTDNKWLYFLNLIYRGIITGYINKQIKKPVVFNGQCNFSYKISPWVNSNIKQIELIHSFNTFSWIRIPFITYYFKTIMISKIRIDNHIDQYKQLQIPEKYVGRIEYICNGIQLPNHLVVKNFNDPLRVLYVGRGTSEKRVHLIAAIAEAVQNKNPQITFTIVGDVEGVIPNHLKKYCIIKGSISDENELARLYQESHVLLITSNTEGFPLVVMEAMAYGCAIIATPVGDLPIHVQHKNGFITSIIDAEKVADEMTQYLLQLSTDKFLLEVMSKNNIEYSKKHFDLDIFNKKYQDLIG